jgi:hypothetical protein
MSDSDSSVELSDEEYSELLASVSVPLVTIKLDVLDSMKEEEMDTFEPVEITPMVCTPVPIFLFLNAFVQECVADDPPVLESAAQCLLLEPSAECLLLEPSAECLLLEPSAECPLLEPSAECLQLEPSAECPLLGREDAVLVTANCAYPFFLQLFLPGC